MDIVSTDAKGSFCHLICDPSIMQRLSKPNWCYRFAAVASDFLRWRRTPDLQYMEWRQTNGMKLP